MESGGSDSQSGGTFNHAKEMTLAPSRVDVLWTNIASADWRLNSLEKKNQSRPSQIFTKCSS